MAEALLDTNFIISCARQKIDFFEEIESLGFSALVPEQVIGELMKLSSSEKRKVGREAELALKILEANKFHTIGLEVRNVDKGIIKFARKNPETVIATLDNGIKEKIPNRKLVIRGKKKIGIA